MKRSILFLSGLFIYGDASTQNIKLDSHQLEAVQVSMTTATVQNKKAVKLIKDSSVIQFDEPSFAKVKGIEFRNGIIEVKVLSRLLANAPDFARGFIGIAFRINDSNSRYESFYIRPTNARANDQVRRNHSVQYYAYPDYKFDRLRKEAPERYESYADLELDKWITLRIEVEDDHAKLFINNNEQPSLLVNDLKLGSQASGGIALWVDIGTEGFFSDLKIIQFDK